MAALTLGTLAAAAAVGAAGGSVIAMKKKAKKIAGQKPVEPPATPMDAKPSIPVVDPIADNAKVETQIRQAAGRRKAKLGRSGTLLTGPSGIPDAAPGARRTLIGQ